MIKIKNTKDSISSEYLIWDKPTTEISTKDTYNIHVHPVSSIYADGTVIFNVPPQPKGMLKSVRVVTKFKIKNAGIDLVATDQVSLINNFTNALWEIVDIKVADRLDLMQSMRNSYAFQTFLFIVLNYDINRSDILFNEQLFKMDEGETKTLSETLVYSEPAETVPSGIKNFGAVDRAKRIALSKSITVASKLHCPLISSRKVLPTNMRFRITLHKNADKFLLLGGGEDPKYKVVIENVFLNVKYRRPTDVILSSIEERLASEAAEYFVTRPELIVKPIGRVGRNVQINNLFPGRLPQQAFMFVQKTTDYVGSYSTNPFAFIPINKIQLFLNGIPHFPDPLENTPITVGAVTKYVDNALMLKHLYNTVGKDVRGGPLITSENFQLNFIIAFSFTPDKANTSAAYLSPQREASTQLEFDLNTDEVAAQDLILIILAIHDRVIKIDKNREVEIVE